MVGFDFDGHFVDYSYDSGILRQDVEIALGRELGRTASQQNVD